MRRRSVTTADLMAMRSIATLRHLPLVPKGRERGRITGSSQMKLLAGNSNLPLARAIADYLELPLTDASVRRFADEEVFVEIQENVRGEDVFVVQSTSFPTNDNLMEL